MDKIENAALDEENNLVKTNASGLKIRPDLLLRHVPTTPSDRSVEKRRLRKYFVLNVIREKGPLSRAEIAKVSGLNLPSVSSLVDELVSDGLAVEEEARMALRGRRPIPVSLRADAACVLGIDIGKSTSMTMLTDLATNTILKTECPTPALESRADHAAWALQLVKDTFAQLKAPPPPLCGIGVALPGLIAVNEDHVIAPGGNGSQQPETVIAGLVQDALIEAYGVQVLVENDARVMVPGVRWFREEPPSQNFAVLNIGFGLGMGISLNGRLLSGAQGFAGELGHIPLGRPGVACFCGGTGCLETTASGAGLASMARQRGLATDDVEELVRMAREGDAAAQEIFNEFAAALGRGVATIVNLFNPEAIILTGKVSRASDVFLDRMNETVAMHALPAALTKVRVVVEDARTNLSLLGAVAVVLNHIFFSSRVSYEEVI